MKKQYLLIISIVVIGLIAAGGIIWSNNQSNETATKEQAATTHKPVTERHRAEIAYMANAGETSLEQLKKEADNVITEKSKYGELVTSIEGHKGGTDGKYWSFYIDGKMAEVGAGSYTQKGGEEIVWKFQKL